MLVLTRKINEGVRIGEDVEVTILRISGNSVRIGITAPRSTGIARTELDLVADEAEPAPPRKVAC